jgi:mRNA interferase MazF
VLVIQADTFNASRIRTVIVATLSSNLRLAAAPGNVRLARRETELPSESVVNVSQVLTLDRGLLVERVSELSASAMGRVESGLRLVLAL